MLIAEAELMTKVREVVAPLGCHPVRFGPYGNKRASYGHIYGPSVVLACKRGKLSTEEIAYIDAQVTRNVPGITGVSIDVPISS